MHIPSSFIYALIGGLISALGTILASKIGSNATTISAKTAFDAVSRQIEFQTASKISEFRQAWINDLRDSMANLQSYGVTPNIDHAQQREFYMFGTKVELLMNKNDPNYQKLQDCMYNFLLADTINEKFGCNAPFIEVCQDILKKEWETLKKELREANQVRKSL